MLGEEMQVPVLCVAQVIGAGDATTAEDDNFNHPNILIRDGDVKGFYTPTFAPAIDFVRTRHAKMK